MKIVKVFLRYISYEWTKRFQKSRIFYLLFLIVIFSLIFEIPFKGNRRRQEDSYDSLENWNRCEPILQNGSFIEVDHNKCRKKSIATYNEEDFNCIRKWKPNGCDLYFYPPAEFKKCFKSISDEKFVVFVGDSRLRHIYNKFVWSFKNITLPWKYTTDHSTFDKQTKTNFTYLQRIYMDQQFLFTTKEILKALPKYGSSVVVIGITLHMKVKYKNDEKGLKVFQEYLLKAKDNLNAIGERATILWFLQSGRSTSLNVITQDVIKLYKNIQTQTGNKSSSNTNNPAKFFLLLLLGVRGREKLLPKHTASVHSYNKVAEKVLNETLVKMWHSAKDMAEKSFEDFADSQHLADYDNYNLMQMILNIKCNKLVGLGHEFCCT